MTEKIVVKKVVVGTPVKRVTAGSFSVTNLGGVDVTATESDGSILAYNPSTENYEVTNLRGDDNVTVTFDSAGNTYTFAFTNTTFTGSLIPDSNEAYDLGSATNKFRSLFLSGDTITLGSIDLKDSSGALVVVDSGGNSVSLNISLGTSHTDGNTDILTFDSGSGQFTFRDSDVARTDVAETFHQGITVDNGATIDSATITNLANTQLTGSQATLTNATVDSATITNLANTQLTGSQATFDSARIAGQLTVGGNLNVTGDLVYDDMTADSATFSGSVAIGTNLSVGGNLNVAGDLVYDDMTADSATFAGTVSVGTNITSPLGRIVNLTGDSATVTNIANTQFTGSQATIDSADITVIKTTTATVTNASIDSATVTNLANTQFTGSQATFDSVNITTLNATNLTFSSASITDLTVDSAKIGGIDLTGNNLTTTGKILFANVYSTEGDLPSASTYHGMFAHVHGTGRGYFAHGGAWHRLVDSSSTGEQQVYALYSNNARVTNAQIDSATITNLANTQLTGSQATFDSANIGTLKFTTLTNTTSDITEGTNLYYTRARFDSALGDTTSIGTIRGYFSTSGDLSYNSSTGVFSIDVEQIYSQANFDSDFLTRLQTQIDSASFNVLTAQSIHTDSASFDSATITNLANTQFTGSQATIDSADITTIKSTTATITNATVDSATITNLANTQLTGSQATIDSANIGTLKFTTLTNTTSDITEGTNLYYTDARARNSIGLSDVGGDGSLAYDSSTGRFTYTGPSAAEVRAHLTANKGLSVTSGEFNIDSANVKGMLQAGTGVTYDSSNGLISIGQDVSTTSDVTFGKIHGDSAELHVIDFDTTISGHAPYKEGRLFYDNTHKTLNYYDDITNVVHEIGLEEHQRVFNNTGATIKKGSALYFSGNYTSGAIDVPTVGLADATDVNAYNAQGLAAGDIANNSYGHCIIAGQLTEVNTSHLNDGTNFFVSVTTPGSHQNASPTYPNFPMCLGWVVLSGDSSNGILLVNQQNHSVNSFRVRTSAHIGSDLQVDGNLTILGSQTTVGQSNVTQGAPFYRLNEGDAIGEAGTTYTGTGLDDAFFSGHFTGTTAQTYYLRIDGVGTGAGGVDTFEVALGNDSTFQSPILTKVAITGNKQEIHSTDNISVEFGATTGHDSGDRWTGVASPVNVDTGFFTNRNTGTSGVGYTHMGLYFDVSDEKWKLLDEYDSTPTGTINAADASFSLATLVAETFEGNLTGAVTGNASTATALASGRNFELTGQITASAVSFDGTGNVTLVTDIAAGVIKDSDINASAAIADTKLATISTAGKVNNSATTATDANTGSTIVARDASGNFTAGIITADFDRSANTTVTAGTYGSASLVPVLTVDASGFIDSVGTVSVAGVSSTAFDSGTGVFTINTADGGSFTTNVTSRISNLPDSDFTINGILGLSDSAGAAAPSTIRFNNKRTEFRMNMDSVSTGELPASFGGGENRTFAFINASGGDSDLVIIGKDSDKANSVGNIGYGYYTNEDRGKSFLKVKGFGSYIEVDSMNFTVLDGNSVGYYYNNGGQTGLTSQVDILSQHGGRRGPQANLGRHVVLGNHNLRAQANEHPVTRPGQTDNNWAIPLPAHYANQAAYASARIVSKLTAGATTLAYEFGRDSAHIERGVVAWDSASRVSEHPILRLGYQHPTSSRTGYDGYRGSANGRYYNGSTDKFTWNSTWDSDKLQITMEAMIPNSGSLNNAASNKLLNATPQDAIIMESFYDSDRSMLDSANSRGHFGFEIRRKNQVNQYNRTPENSTSGSIMKARGDGRVEFGGDLDLTGNNLTTTGNISADSAQLAILKITNELNIENDDPVIKLQDNNVSGTPYHEIDASTGYLRFHADKGNTGTSSKIGFTVDGGADGVRITKGGASGYANVKIGGGPGSSNGSWPLHIHGNTGDRTSITFQNNNVSENSIITLADNGDFKFRRYAQNDSDIFTISSTNKATFAGDVHADSALIGGNPASTRLLAVYDRNGNLLN